MKNFPSIHVPDRFARFCFIGVISSLVDIGLMYLLTTYLGIWYILSATISYCCGIIVSYGLNKRITFGDTGRNYATQFATFAAISISCLIINLGIIWMAVDLFALNYMLGKIIATFCAVLWNYHGQSRITFKSSG
ncbi:MAG: GtrA family protein [Methanoregula sp.]|nr:GtrA family protein [Methanoregula sp.]